MRGAAAGVVAAAGWAACEPLLGRALRTPFSDVRMLGRLTGPERGWRARGLAVHLANGAVFGWAFERLAGGGIRRGVVVAQAENAAFWPMMFAVDRLHADRRAGTWPPIATNPRTIGYELVSHTIFGAILGALTAR
jgi:hypothetical protein